MARLQTFRPRPAPERDTLPSGEESITWGTAFFDYNNDSWLDLFYVAGNIGTQTFPPQPNAMFENNEDGTFDDISIESGLNDTRNGRSASIADFDQERVR